MLFAILFMSLPANLTSALVTHARAEENIVTTQGNKNTKITQNGCSRKIEKTEEIHWRLPRKPIDLVILQDASGSFANTIPSVKKALKTLTTFVSEEDYDENNPRLVKTDDPDTSDRVMVASFQGVDGYNYYNNDTFTGKPDVYGGWGAKYDYQYKSSGLTTNQNAIHSFIDNISVAGGTPTVPAIEDAIKQYNANKGSMANERKTVFLVITDGVANGKRDADGKVRIDYSGTRNRKLQKAWSYNQLSEASQDIIGRVNEVKDAGNTLKGVVGSNGTVVVGFWEDVALFNNDKAQYYDVYLNGFGNYFNIGDNRSVQEIFHEALQGMASPDKEVNGKNVSFYVNEQDNIDKFSARVLESVGAALVKEDIKGEFDVTPGYKVDAVRINGKKIVSEVKDSTKEILGKIEQNGDKVTISVPESVFNPGKNNFDYDLSKEAHAEQVDEDDEQDPPAGYQPAKEQVQVPELTGKFKVGDFETQTIGGHNETVEVQKLEYCYPSATKKIEDQDLSNDTGTIEDPLQLTKKPAYAANLSDKAEEFTYTVNYNFNNVPYEFKKNVMLTDPLDYRLEVVRSSATGPDGPLKTRVVKGQDSAGNERDIVVADVPSDGTNYNYLVLKQAELKITVKLKEEFRKDQASKNYLALLQDSNGFGLVNQGNIMWNGEDDSPNPDPHAKTADKPSTIRRSNPVYVKPPLSTDIEKKVNEKEHADLATEDELFEYKVSVPWPGTADKFTVTDTVVPELEVQESTIKATIDGKTYAALTKATTLKDQTVEISLDKADMDRLTRLVNRRGGDEVKKLDLVFQAKIRPNADLSKYKKNGTIKVPNKADVALNDIKKTSNEVTVTPPKPKEPTVEKKINETLEDYQTFEGQPYTYNISTAIPADVSSYKKFVISDTLDNDLEFDGEATIKGDAADLFTVEKNGQTVTATVKPGKFKDLAKYSTVELIIPAKVKQGVSGKVIDNKAKVEYTNKSNVDKEVESTPVHVTPPPVTKKINENLDHLDIPTGEQYKYNIKTKLPTDIKDYKKFVITDTLENELSVINEGETKPVIKGAAAFFDVEVQGQTVTATMKNFATAADLAGQEVELEIPAKINDGVTRVKIPNTAKIRYTDKNDHSGEKETKPVTVTPPSEPTVKKKINEKLDTAVIGAETDYTYNIKAKLPNDITSYKSFVITDTLDENLQVGEATITGEANKFFTVTGTGQTVTATMKDFENAGDYAGKEVELVIKAKVKKESTAEAIENKAKITYTNKNNQQGEKETKPVTVTPPPITKKVNNQEHADLNKLSESFTYTVDTKVPEVADKFEVSDQLVNELTFDGDATVEVDGQKATDLTVQTNGQTLSVTFDKDQVKKYAGKAVHITFKAKIKDNVSYDALLAAYPNPAGDKPLVPNTASFIINDNPDSKKESTPVTVTPPPTSTPELKKKVNGQERYELTKRDEEFTYTLTTEMPANASVFEITDELKDVLQFVGKDGSATVKIDGKAAGKKATVTVKDQTIKITFAEASVKADAGKAIEVTFKAKIKDGANLASYITSAGTTEIPNKASYDIDNNPKYHKDSNEVPVTPPTPKEPEIKKDVNEKPAETLVNRNDTFTYNVNTTVPTDATAFEVTDTLVDVLEFAGASSASVNGEAIAPEQIKVEGQTITLSLTEAQVKANGGKAVKLSFTAKIKDGANLSAYITKDGKTEVPNKASYKVDFPNKPGVTKDSNTVPVTPPTPGEPEIKKDVNGKPAETLQARNEEFTYHVNTEVPADATAFEVHDTLVDVLEFADGTGRATATLGEEALAPEQIKVDGQKITVTLTEDQVKANAGKAVKLTFTAKIKDGANLSAYVTKEGKTEVPNKASYKASFPNKPGVTKDSNEVPVTPPSPELPPIEKKVNNEDQATLGARDEVFTYKVTTQVPQDVTGFAVYDTIEKVLEFAGENAEAVATLDGQALDASHISFKGQKITVKLTEEEAKANAGKTVELTFKAKIKDGANLSEYVNEDGVTRVPNTAKYNFNNDPGTEQKSKPVPVIPPTPGEPEIKKDVNDKPAETLAKRDEVFTYHVNTNVPTDATAFEVHDTLVDVLEFAGASSASLNGKELKANQIKVDGQTITLTLTEEQVKENGGKAVNLTFTAKIKKGANLGAYLTPAGKTEIPNKASYKVDFPNKPGVTKDSNTVPVTPPNPGQPEIEKQVNGAAEALLGDRDEVFTYTINTVMPEDATAFAVTDTLDPVLEFEGTANVTLDGKATDATVTTDGQTLTVNFPEATVKSSAGKKVQVTFKAKVKADADLTPYLTDRGYTVPNTASYILNNNPGLKKDSNTVPVVVPKVPEPEISKKINRTLDHLDVDYDAGYMYNVNTKLPADIDKYKEFTVTDTLEPVLEIAGTPVAYVDGYDAKEALETKVEGNTVTVTVKDFARLKGFKEIQLYIPSKLKSGSDLTPYAEQLVPNKATVSFKDRNGQSGNKESKPVTVKPRDPEKPRDPDPNRPQKTVGPEDGSAPGSVYRLKTAGELFRFDITTPVPTDPKDENGNPVKDQYGRDVKTKLTNLTFSDEIDKALKVKKIALKVENAQFASIQAALQAKLDQAKQELKDLAGQPTTGSIAEKVAAAEAKVADLTAQVEAAKTAAAEDAESAEKAAAVTTLEASLKAAQDELTALKENADKSGGLPTSADQKQAQEKLEQEIKSLEEAKAKLDKAVENLSKVSNERGEITGDALSAFATVTYDEATNLVTVEITDETILDTLKGSTLRLVLYTSFKDGVDVSKYVDNGVPNVAKVSFNHKPKETYEVKVFPPAPNTPPPGPYTPPTPVIPPAPNGDLPPAPIPDKPKPKKPTPKVPEQPQPILPKTAAVDSPVMNLVGGLMLGMASLLIWKRKKEQ